MFLAMNNMAIDSPAFQLEMLPDHFYVLLWPSEAHMFGAYIIMAIFIKRKRKVSWSDFTDLMEQLIHHLIRVMLQHVGRKKLVESKKSKVEIWLVQAYVFITGIMLFRNA